MQVALAGESDCRAIAAIAQVSGATLDPVAELGRDFARLWVARDAGEVAGFLLGWHVADEVHVIDLCVRPEQRRRGIARRLLEELLAFARAQRGRVLLLEVRRSNAPAIALYRAAGFAAVGVRRAYYSDDGEDAIEMRLDLDPASGAPLPREDAVDVGGPR